MFSFKSIALIAVVIAAGAESSGVPVAAPLYAPAHVGYAHAVPQNIPPYAAQVNYFSKASLIAPAYAPVAAPLAAPVPASFAPVPAPFAAAPVPAPFAVAPAPFAPAHAALAAPVPAPLAAPAAYAFGPYAAPFPYASAPLIRSTFGPAFVR